MLSLDFNEKSLEVQRQVVIEEFKQRNLNQPYGDTSHIVRDMAYEVHPYKWPTIGKEISHIENATMEDVRSFFFSHYAPNNAILAVTGNISFEETIAMAEKWFGPIQRRDVIKRNLIKEPEQLQERRETVERNVPVDAIYMAFHMSNRKDRDYYAYDMLSDLLSNGRSSRFIQNLVQEKKFFSNIDAYISGSVEEGLFHISGKPVPSISLKDAEKAIWEELEAIKNSELPLNELDKVKNKYESEQIFSNMNYLNVATNLAFFELLGNAEDINNEVEKYRSVDADHIQMVAKKTFTPNNSSTLYYKAKK